MSAAPDPLVRRQRKHMDLYLFIVTQLYVAIGENNSESAHTTTRDRRDSVGTCRVPSSETFDTRWLTETT